MAPVTTLHQGRATAGTLLLRLHVPVAVGLKSLHGLLQVSVLFTRQEAGFIERRQTLFSLRQIALDQVELARILKRAAVLGIDPQRLRVIPLCGVEVWRLPLAQA